LRPKSSAPTPTFHSQKHPSQNRNQSRNRNHLPPHQRSGDPVLTRCPRLRPTYRGRYKSPSPHIRLVSTCLGRAATAKNSWAALGAIRDLHRNDLGCLRLNDTRMISESEQNYASPGSVMHPRVYHSWFSNCCRCHRPTLSLQVRRGTN